MTTTTKACHIRIGGPKAMNPPIIRFKLPKGGMRQMAGDGRHFGKPLGGRRWLNHHLFIDGAKEGEAITAALEIWDREMTDGRMFPNIDLTDPKGRAPTHEMKVYMDPKQVPRNLPKTAQTFELHNGGGLIVLNPID